MNSKVIILIGGKEVSRSSVNVAGIDMADYPDFCDAYVEEASFVDGTPLTEDELFTLTEEFGCELAHERMF